MKISLVIPAYNESAIIADTVSEAKSYLAGKFQDYELIIVDDGSTDGMASILKPFVFGRTRVVGYEPNRGKGFAVRTGVLESTGDLVFYTDADMAYGLDVIGRAVEAFERGNADIIAGSRKLDSDGYSGYPMIRHLASKCFSFATRLCSGVSYDTQCGFKGFRRETADRVFSECTTDGFAFDFEVMMTAESMGLSIEQMPVRIINHRLSKISLFRDSFRMLGDIISIRHTVSEKEKIRRRNEARR